MFSSIFNKYYPVSSKIHHMNSSSKLICILLFTIILIIGQNPLLLSLLIILTFSIMWLSRVPLPYYIKSLDGLNYVLVLIVIICLIFKASIIFIIFFVVKIIVGTLYTMVLTYTTSSTEIIYGLETIFKPLEFIKISVHKVALFFFFLYRLVPTIFEQIARILKTQASRGIDYKHSNIKGKIKAIFSLLVPTFLLIVKQNSDLVKAMEVRLYNYNKNRTNYRVNKWRSFDDFMVVIHMFILALFIVEEFMI